MNDFLQQFLIESRELANQATEGLLHLEQSPHDPEILDEVFRAFHTLKGGAGIVEFGAMETRVHAAEELLSEARSKQRAVTAGLIGECLACIDQVLIWLDAVEQSGDLPALELPGKRNAEETGAVGANASSMGASASWIEDLLERNPPSRAVATVAIRFVPEGQCFYEGADPLAHMSALPQLLALEFHPATDWPPLEELDPSTCNLILTALARCSARDVETHLRTQLGEYEIQELEPASAVNARGGFSEAVRDLLGAQSALLAYESPHGFAGRVASAGLAAGNVMRFCRRPDLAELLKRATETSLAENSGEPLREAIDGVLAQGSEPAAALTTSAAQPTNATARTLRVDAQRIDSLVRLTGELTVAKNAIELTARRAQAQGNSLAEDLKRHHGLFERLIAELQSSVVGMRVLPLHSVFQRFPRVVREMSSSLGKPAKIEFEGEQTEADKTIVEMLFEPLLHVVRNSLDHGIEPPSLRQERGKPKVATLQLRALRDGGQVRVQVSDDGGGVDVVRVRDVAVQRGIASPEELLGMSDEQIIDLIFAPGFSTAEKVTELSGRGVGMDAVRIAVERVGGRVSIQSRANFGTTVSFALPFSVMMSQVMTVEAGGQVLGIPLEAVIETIRLPQSAFSGLGAARVFVHRDRTIPVLDLASLLGFNETAVKSSADATVVIAAVGGQLVGIDVDRPGERMDVMLKPLDGLLSGTPGIAGTTLLGDGRVLLVLDIAEVLL